MTEQQHRTYLLAPYRVACVAGGSFVAFIWTIFPSPLTDRTWLRRDLSATIYILANYFGVLSTTIRSNVNGTAGDVNTPGTPAHHLFKVGRKIYGKVMLLISSMSQHSEWQKWEPTIGGKFPREAYGDIIMRSTRILAYLSLASYTMMHPTRLRLNDMGSDTTERRSRRAHMRETSLSLHTHSRGPSASTSNREWMDALADSLDILRPIHQTILSSLTLLSSALLSGQRLPPFIPLPRPYELTQQLMRMHHSTASTSAATEQDDASDGGPIRMVDSRTCYDRTAARKGGRNGNKKASRGGGQQDLALAKLLSPRNLERPGYAEFAVLQVCTTLVCDDLEGLVRAVSGLVGVVDFSFKLGEESESNLDLGNTRGKRKVY